MGLFVDSAYLDDVADVCASYPITGVTTNPSIMLAAYERGQRLDDLGVLRELLRLCEGPVFAQPSRSTDDALYAAASRYLAVAPNRIVLKLPITPIGVRVGLRVTREGGRIAFTAVSSLSQAYCGATTGAGWIIPYFGRLRRAGADPCDLIARMGRLLAQQGGTTRILAASIKTPADLAEATLVGAHDVTAEPAVIQTLLVDPLTEAAMRQFDADWQRYQDHLASG
jgi:TalC/MipB family fructose-6-phosphate aldolase